MPGDDIRRQWTEAFGEELEELRVRQPKASADNLVGLAISGGGIRSATFALGALEVLKQVGILKKLNLLSTVSGGGYIGSWLSGSCKRHPNWLDPDADWSESIAHLRRYSNYLSPKVGFFSADTWSMVTIWFRNALLVQVTVVLAIACALMLPRPLLVGFLHWPEVGNWRWTTILLFILGVVGIAGNQIRFGTLQKWELLRAKNWPFGLAAAAILAAAAWAYGSYVGFDPFHDGEVDYSASAPIAVLLVLAAFSLQPVTVKLIGSFWRGDDPPQNINFTQAWAQWIVVLPMMASGYLVAAVLWGESQPGADIPLAAFDSFGKLFSTAWLYWPFPLSVVFVSIWLLSFCSVRTRRDWKGVLAALLAPIASVAVLHALFSAIMVLFHEWARDPATGLPRAFVWGPPLVLFAFTLTVVMLIGMMGRQSSEGAREWWSRLGAWLCIYGFAWMVIAVAAVYGPRLVYWAVSSHPWPSLSAIGGWVGTVTAGLFAGKSNSTGTGDAKTTKGTLMEVIALVAPFVFIAGLLIGVATLLDQLVSINSDQTWSTLTRMNSGSFLTVSLIVWAACIVALLVMAARVDINEFSLNAFYRNRLVRCYLGATRFRPKERQPQNFTGFDDGDDVGLCELSSKHAPQRGPFHIVNCALNLGGSSDLALHTRHSASFTLSPLHCGSAYRSREQSGQTEEMGYAATEGYGGPFGTPTLGQAISVSGAAASPNMGYHTSPVVSFMLTVFNVRLGWWFPNPLKSGVKFPSPHFSLRYLFAELFGGANDKSRFLNISDGGHFENLATYELIRRRCRVIIVSDGECDPDLKFEGLGTLIRVCEVDFGVRIALDVEAIRWAKDSPWSTKRYAAGRIHYPDGEQGVLIYLKASMTGKEDTAILQYKASHREFPHETTGDQFYGEDQFESYRRLGREIALTAFETASDDPFTFARRLLDAQLQTAQAATV